MRYLSHFLFLYRNLCNAVAVTAATFSENGFSSNFIFIIATIFWESHKNGNARISLQFIFLNFLCLSTRILSHTHTHSHITEKLWQSIAFSTFINFLHFICNHPFSIRLKRFSFAVCWNSCAISTTLYSVMILNSFFLFVSYSAKVTYSVPPNKKNNMIFYLYVCIAYKCPFKIKSIHRTFNRYLYFKAHRWYSLVSVNKLWYSNWY